MGDPVRVLVIDDSSSMRRLIRHVLSLDRRVAVIGEAADAAEAREMIRALSPDVLTLDVEMPGLSGLDLLARLMQLRPMPVVMVSSETRRGSAAAIEALALGAVDCIGKPLGLFDAEAFSGLADVLVAASTANVSGARSTPVRRGGETLGEAYRWSGRLVLIGASTGGVDAVERVLGTFPVNCPPTVIVQHMPPSFLASFAARLDSRIAPAVSLAVDGAPLRQGHIYLAPGGPHHLTIAGSQSLTCQLLAESKRNGHRPSVDLTLESALPVASSVVAAVLTGMGRDGAGGLRALREAGARTLAQDEASSVVWGMPRAAWEAGGAEELVPLDRIGPRLLDLCARSSAALPAA
ncbi:chemotaxis-specific protein-glutamate methyltransferase CheB [Paracoccus suum]|uniref:Protein-glutamate methylesterase/protein-glutamine glutaminase n=1 Tax=Paracoccus suum TaxID=2259340 RepID=A0A344PPG9_9RHOB|nr:chemotaxis-specific protein-glutamate methyltransferase CheB [Paracoccus suum]